MGRTPCCSKVGLHRGPWTAREDALLTNYIQLQGDGNWRSLPKKAGLLRCGKSCRLRWMNYLRPDIKRGNITPDEEDLIIKMHALLGNRWSLIAGRLPGRTDNEIKNYWNTHLSKRLRSQGTDPMTHKKLSDPPHLRLREPKKRRNFAADNRNLKSNVETPHEKLKVHYPKPTKIKSWSSFSLSRNSSFDWTTTTTTATGSWGGGGSGSHGNEVGFLIGDVDHHHYHDVINGSDLECQSEVPLTDDTSLEKLYEEYLQLLNTEDPVHVQLDSFAESLQLVDCENKIK